MALRRTLPIDRPRRGRVRWGRVAFAGFVGLGWSLLAASTLGLDPLAALVALPASFLAVGALFLVGQLLGARGAPWLRLDTGVLMFQRLYEQFVTPPEAASERSDAGPV